VLLHVKVKSKVASVKTVHKKVLNANASTMTPIRGILLPQDLRYAGRGEHSRVQALIKSQQASIEVTSLKRREFTEGVMTKSE